MPCPLTTHPGVGGVGLAGTPLHYKGTPFHRIIPGFMAQGGDVTHFNGTGGESIHNFGSAFADECIDNPHFGPGCLGLANAGKPDTNKSQFYVCFRATPWLDTKSQVIGRMCSGFDILKKIEKCGSEDGTPLRRVSVCDSGEFILAREKAKEKKAAEALAMMPKIFDDQMPGYPNAFEWFVVDLRRMRQCELTDLHKQKIVFRRELQEKLGAEYQDSIMNEEWHAHLIAKYVENKQGQYPTAKCDEEVLRSEAAAVVSAQLAAQDEAEAVLYQEARMKWSSLSDREYNYYDEMARMLPLAMDRIQSAAKTKKFEPQVFEAYMDLTKDRP